MVSIKIENQEGKEVLNKQIGPGENKISLSIRIFTTSGERIEKDFFIGYSIVESIFYNPEGSIRIISDSFDFGEESEKVDRPYQTKLTRDNIIVSNPTSVDIIIDKWKIFKNDVNHLEIGMRKLMYPDLCL